MNEKTRANLLRSGIKFTEREITVIKLRVLPEDGRPRTLEEVGKVFGVTRERIRQIEAKALKKFRKAAIIAGLDEWIDLK